MEPSAEKPKRRAIILTHYGSDIVVKHWMIGESPIIDIMYDTDIIPSDIVDLKRFEDRLLPVMSPRPHDHLIHSYKGRTRPWGRGSGRRIRI